MAETFQELEVWNAAMDLAVEITDLALGLPGDFRWLGQQIMRSAESGPSNIAEGFERRTDGDFARFLRIAKASIGETESHLAYAVRRRIIAQEQHDRFAPECVRVKKMLNRLIAYLRK